MKRKLILLWVICLFLMACGSARGRITGQNIEDKPDSLKVYLTGDPAGGQTVHYYYSCCRTGPMWPLFMAPGYEGHILYKPLQDFEKETGIHLELQYFQLKGEMEKQLAADQREGTLPDVVLLDNYTYGGEGLEEDNVFRLMAADWFYDTASYMEEEGVYDSQQYYNEVLEAGRWRNQQLLLLIQFNLSAVYAAEEDTAGIGALLERGMSLEDMIGKMEAACNSVEDGVEAVDYLESKVDISLIVEGVWQALGRPRTRTGSPYGGPGCWADGTQRYRRMADPAPDGSGFISV